MRDLLLAAIVFGLLPYILMRPSVGAYAWAWLSLMNPHRLTFGFAYFFPFAQIVALATLFAYLFKAKERKPFPVSALTVVYLLFIFWMSVTSLFAINTPEVVLDKWIAMLKLHLMTLFMLMLIRDRDQIEKLIWVVTFSVGFYGIKGGIWTVLNGGGNHVLGPEGTMLADNNALGLALVVIIPFVYYLYQISKRRLIRLGVAGSGIAMCFSILGSQSRGAFLALLAMAFMLAWKSRKPVLMGLLTSCVLAVAMLSMPETWSGRMETIQTHEQDRSAQSRIYSWLTMWNMALDRPLVGGGFGSDNGLAFSLYAPKEGFETFAGNVYVAHSIYFQALGEHGFPGLLLYLALGFFTWRKAGEVAQKTRDDPELGAWLPLLMNMTQVSLLGFAVGGAFLSLVHFDLPFYIMSFVVLAEASLRERVAKLAATGTTPFVHEHLARRGTV